MTAAAGRVLRSCLRICGPPLLLALAAAGCSRPNPFAKNDLCFDEEQLGASGRLKEFTPVRCSDRSKKLGENLGADYGVLSFRDLNADGQPEVIVESSWRCRLSASCWNAWRVVAKVQLGPEPRVVVTERRHLDHLTPGAP